LNEHAASFALLVIAHFFVST